MASQDYLIKKNYRNISKSVNVVDLMNVAKLREKKEKRYTAFVSVAALSALVISLFIISL